MMELYGFSSVNCKDKKFLTIQPPAQRFSWISIFFIISFFILFFYDHLSLSHTYIYLVLHLSFVFSPFHTHTHITILFKDGQIQHKKYIFSLNFYDKQQIKNFARHIFLFFKLTFHLKLFFYNIFLLPIKRNE